MNKKVNLLFVLIIALFLCTFFSINLKYDRFYRVKGIDNDNRAMIEAYLSEEEQTYLVENQIPLDDFMKYITYDDFKLQNYRYYHLLEDTNRYKTNKEILVTGNKIQSILASQYDTNYFKVAQNIIENDLEYGLIHNKNFDESDLSLYSLLRPLYGQNDDSYVDQCKLYKENLIHRGLNENDIKDFLSVAVDNYNAGSLAKLMENKDAKTILVPDPSRMDVLVNQNHYIASYTPRNITLLQDVPRVRYAMYLKNEAYQQLKKMIADNKVLKKLVVKNSYSSYASKKEQGYNEYQLGLLVDFTIKRASYSQFEESEISTWLQENAYRYGFILRYPLGKEGFTNRMYDPHTYRFVGVKVAKELFEKNLCLEEYQDNKRKSE